MSDIRNYMTIVEDGSRVRIDAIAALLARAGHADTPDIEALASVRKAYKMLDAVRLSFQDVVYDKDYVAQLVKEVQSLKSQVAALKQQMASRPSARPTGKTMADVLPSFS